ncbi:hypothetical protein NDU88_006311 [Pleurodeles waltl]|uniref:Uncharacterized protein n=1 Tax=Pleurodeles waltl TaxID=8319 RepID=A0AAV7QIN7_PLEWA|nr:hypothetical protein NDU88_006311 [Pleurodeles waltl]
MRVCIRASETPGAKSSRKREFTSRNNKDDRLPKFGQSLNITHGSEKDNNQRQKKIIKTDAIIGDQNSIKRH